MTRTTTPTPGAARHAAAPVASLSRRRFLRTTLIAGAGVAALAGAGFAWLRRSSVDGLPVGEGIRHLTAAEYYLFQRVTAVLLPVQGTPLTPLSQVPVVQHIDHMIGLLPGHLRKQVGMGLTLFDNAAVVSGWHGRRFVDLETADAVQYFDDWSHGNTVQKALATLVKRFVYVAYWRDPATWGPVEFDGPVSEKWGLAYLGNAPLPDQQPVSQEAVQ